MGILILIFLVGILAALFSALLFLVRDRSSDNRMVRALTWRVGLSIGLFLMLMLAAWMGWIEPHGLYPSP